MVPQSVSFNVIVTLRIYFSLLRMGTRAQGVPSRSVQLDMYTSSATTLIEFTAPFQTFVVFRIDLGITAAQNVRLMFAFSYVWSKFYIQSKSFRDPLMGIQKANY